MKGSSIEQNISKRLQKLEKRVANLEYRMERERRRGKRQGAYGVAGPLAGIGIWMLIDSEVSTGKVLGALLLVIAAYIAVVLGSDLEYKYDQAIISFFKNISMSFTKLAQRLKIRKRT